MNQQRLNEIYENPITINNSDVDDLRQLNKDYPYFSKPFEILARYYFQTNHYRFEDMLRQAAMRVRDRKLLYEYIHSENTGTIESVNSVPSIDIEEPIVYNEIIEIPEEKDEKKLGLDAFLNDQEQASISEIESDFLPLAEISTSHTSEEIVEAPFEFEGHFKLHDTINLPEEQDIIGEEIATEFSFSKSFINSESEVKEVESLESEITSNEIKTSTEQLNEELERELIIEEEPEEISSLEAEAILESIDAKETIEEDDEISFESKSMDLDLRKYPIYSIETFVGSIEDENAHDTDSSKDFFSWLKNPKHQESNQEIETFEAQEAKKHQEVKPSMSLDLIEKFISINPQISRPKKEFYSPENMAKRSEVLDLEFVSETLAEIYYQQGNYEFAIKAYEKLSLQNPSKQSFFADLIDKIKKERK